MVAQEEWSSERVANTVWFRRPFGGVEMDVVDVRPAGEHRLLRDEEVAAS